MQSQKGGSSSAGMPPCTRRRGSGCRAGTVDYNSMPARAADRIHAHCHLKHPNMAKKAQSQDGPSLVIVESPAKARTISRFLGRGFNIEASIGHIRDLPQGAKEIPEQYKKKDWAHLGVDVDHGFEPVYVVPAEKRKHVSKLKQALKGAKDLYLATDEDREGEAISWHLCEELKPKVIDGYSSSLYILAKEIEKRGVKTIKPRFVIGGAELIDHLSKKYIEEVFQVPFYDQYSSVEFERMAWQCPQRNEYHIDADAMVLQFLDKNGEDVSPGENGEIVCTSLFNYAMPFIKYAIGDVGIPSDKTCTCGRTLPLMRMVEGRKDSLLLLPNGQMLTPRALTVAVHMFKLYDCIDKFRFTQKKIDVFEIEIKKNDKKIQEETLEKELLNHLRTTLFLHDVKFQVKFVEDIPLDKNGKLRIVLSQLNPNPTTTP